jgi:hypothetical protein
MKELAVLELKKEIIDYTRELYAAKKSADLQNGAVVTRFV